MVAAVTTTRMTMTTTLMMMMMNGQLGSNYGWSYGQKPKHLDLEHNKASKDSGAWY